MDENKFDDKIKRILENPPEMEVDLRALADMRQRLKAAQPDSRRRGSWLWLLPLLLLPFLLGAYLFHLQTQKLQSQIDHLESRLSLQQQNIFKDSIHTSISYQFDTIYRTFYKDKIIERIIEQTVSKNSWLGSTQPGTIQSISRILGVPGSYSLSTRPNSFLPLSTSLLNNGPGLHFVSPLPPMQTKPGETRQLSLFDPVASRPWSMLTANPGLAHLEDEEQQLAVQAMESQVSADPLYHLVPTGFHLGLQASPWVNTNAPSASGGQLYSLSAEIEFANRLRLQLGAGLLKVSSKSEDGSGLGQIPSLPPNDPGDVLNEIYADFSYIQLPVGFKYLFGKGKKWRPFLGAAMVAQRPTKQQFTFEYLSTSVGEYKLNSSLSDGSFSINNLRTNVGVNYSIFNSLSAEAGLIYHRSFEQGNGDYFKLQYWGIDLGLRYGF